MHFQIGSLENVHLADIDVNQKNHLGQTPLHIYAQRGNIDLIIALFAYWAEVNVADNFGSTPLHLAVAVSLRIITNEICIKFIQPRTV